MTPIISPMSHPQLDVFLLGFTAACSLVAALFFLRFWRASRDRLFLAFMIFFLVQGFRDAFTLRLDHPNAGTFWLFLLRLLAVLVILGAILWKNISND